MFCESCGKQLNESSAFCRNCGEPAKAKAAPEAAQQGTAAGAGKADVTGDLTKELKARSRDVWEGVKQLAISPVGGLSSSFQSFGEQRALWAAVGFTILYLLFLTIAFYRVASSIEALAGFASFLPVLPGGMAAAPVEEISFGSVVRLLLCCLVTVFTLAIAAMLARLVFRGKGTFLGDYYIASASLLPISIALLLATVAGIANIEVMPILLVFALVYNILMLYSGCSRISGIPESGAAPAVPIMLIVTLYLTKVAIGAILF